MNRNIFKKKRNLPFTIILTREMIDFVNANRVGKNVKMEGYGEGVEGRVFKMY